MGKGYFTIPDIECTGTEGTFLEYKQVSIKRNLIRNKNTGSNTTFSLSEALTNTAWQLPSFPLTCNIIEHLLGDLNMTGARKFINDYRREKILQNTIINANKRTISHGDIELPYKDVETFTRNLTGLKDLKTLEELAKFYDSEYLPPKIPKEGVFTASFAHNRQYNLLWIDCEMPKTGRYPVRGYTSR